MKKTLRKIKQNLMERQKLEHVEEKKAWKMDSSPGALMEEYELMNQHKYRIYMSNIDKALKNFEYSSEWADLISALGKLNKVISSYPQYQIIPRRIKISKRLAQCMHPALPSGVHLKALETYDVIFSNTGTERLATELFIYSAGLFPLLGYAAMNVRPTLLGIYEKYFVPLGERLRPALSGFLSGVLPGYESGLDHFDRTNSLLNLVSAAVNPFCFYTCLWECVATNASIRLPAVSYILDHYHKKIPMEEQKYFLGKNHDVLMAGLCACLNDNVILVQRNTLEFLLLGFPMHTKLVSSVDLVRLVTNALNTILRRDMSLNRRLYSWLLGTEVGSGRSPVEELPPMSDSKESYFQRYSQGILIKALNQTLKNSLNCDPVDLRPYRILISLLDKVEIGPVVLDEVLCDVIRTMCLSGGNTEVGKSANLLFATFDPAYIWIYMSGLYERACKARSGKSKLTLNLKEKTNFGQDVQPEVDSGPPCLAEVCYLTEFLLETISLETYNETTRVHLPKVFLAITQMLTIYSENLTHDEVRASLKLCMKIVSRVQPMITSPARHNSTTKRGVENAEEALDREQEGTSGLEKSKSDSKLNQSLLEEALMTRSNSNHSMSKKSPKKTKKSKSYSKLQELDKDICSDTGQLIIPSALSTPNLEFQNNSGKKAKKKSPIAKLRSKSKTPDLSPQIAEDSNVETTPEPTSIVSESGASCADEEAKSEPRETSMKEYSILEQCIRQYEIFYQIYVSKQVLQISGKEGKPVTPCRITVSPEIPGRSLLISEDIVEGDSLDRIKDIDRMFNTLKVNVHCRITRLQNLLYRTLLRSDVEDVVEVRQSGEKSVSFNIEEPTKMNDLDMEAAEKSVCNLMNIKLSESLRNSVKLASSLLVDLSTFPNYNQSLTIDKRDMSIPSWLKVLCLVASYFRADKDLQVAAITTLFEMISLLKSQIEHATSPGVTFVIMLPVMKIGHVTFLENQTRVFHVLTSILWDYLADTSVDRGQISSLLYQLHNCLDSGLVETVIGHRMLNTHREWLTEDAKGLTGQLYLDVNENSRIKTNRLLEYKTTRLSDVKVMCPPPMQNLAECGEMLTEGPSVTFRKFELLWHLGRDRGFRGFDKTVLKMFDHLTLPPHMAMKTFVTKWLREALLRGDLSRLMQPLLLIVLASNTKRIGVVNAHLLKKGSSDSQSDIWYNPERQTDESEIIERDVYAISSEDGNIRYHLEGAKQKRSPIRSLQKKFFGVTIGNSAGKNGRPSNYISEKNNSEHNSNISLIVNPLDTSSDVDNADSDITSLSSSAPTKLVTEDVNEAPEESPPKEESCFSSCDEEDGESSTESESETRETSVEKDDVAVAENTVCVKRFVGHCNQVAEVLTEHDRTKNRKTYHLTKSGSHVMEKLEQSFTDIAEGIGYLEESAAAEEYFSSSADSNEDETIENILKEIISQAAENVEQEDLKRHSGASKNSIESTWSEGKEKNDSTDSFSGYDSEISENQEKRLSHDELKQPVEAKATQESGSEDQQNSKKIQSKFNWEMAQETFRRSKQNVEILRQNSACGKKKKNELRKAFFDKLHPLHTHMLLYYGVFDTKQVLYSLQTIRNIVGSDFRTFLCLAMTTTLSDTQIKSLLIRHRKSIFGKGFAGMIANTEYCHVYRGCMYLEALVTICLYYLRSYFQKSVCEGNKLPSSEDIRGNCRIQLASIELLTVLCTELMGVVKEMGKGLASFIADMIGRCKLQKIVLHCILTSVHSFTFKEPVTFTDDILRFNDPDDEKLHLESFQIESLRLLLAVIKLEYEVTIQRGESDGKGAQGSENSGGGSQSPTRPAPNTPTNVKYLPNCPVSQQPMFLSAILNALQADHLRHLHKNWTDVVTSSLGCYAFGSLTNIVISVVHQICTNLDKIARIGRLTLPPDYILEQLEAMTVLSHYCLLDNTQQMTLSHVFNQAYPPANSTTQASNPGQIFNNLVHVFLSTPVASDLSQAKTSQHMAARNAVLSHLPRIVATVAALWDNEIGQARLVNKQLLEFLSPISLHHGVNFLAAVAVAWQQRGEQFRRQSQEESDSRKNSLTPPAKALPQACTEQLSLVRLVSGIRIMPMDSFVQTLHQVVKSPPPIHHPPAGLSLDVSALELFYFYMRNASNSQLTDCWSSLLALMRDGLALTPPAQFVLLAILSEFVQRCPQFPFPDKKDQRDLHDITSRLVEALSTVAGACLEQTTWLRRNLAVKEDLGTLPIDGNRNIKESTTSLIGNQLYSVQAQAVLAVVLANLLDVAYGSQEKDKIVTIVTTLMYNITPYLKNHTIRNIPSFYACSSLLASLSTYQYTRKAWRKDVLDLLLDNSFFQMDLSCLPFWKSILDSLMTYDNTTFRELMNRVSLTQTGGLNIFTSKEQEYEQRAALLKRLAFVIFCSELDQYHKYMPEIQEQLANSLRLEKVVPSVQAAVFLCFRVLLLRMSPDHVTSLWPIIIAEMVQVLLSIEQELKTDTEEFSQHIRVLSGLDSTWVTNTSNGLHSNGHPQWRMVQLETAKLLELGCVLPATNLPHFQMYRWAFVAGLNDYALDTLNGDVNVKPGVPTPSSVFIPHVTRIARLMDYRYTSHSPRPACSRKNHLVLTYQSIANLQDLYGFFSTLSVTWPPYQFNSDVDKEVATCLQEIESILAADFLEKMPQSIAR
ncbi:protein dopey-1 homolog isoform X2 [Lutzomyia longipalpis]|uniref:protein dopey-1 homolog isoform X2 n=1 Tax=Lutzomyia longipalpis TaxID=7200 RepID=UPI002483698C|nr:protein dopey-1 homolog isoform X2 [Lutzomyia longipalpis]